MDGIWTGTTAGELLEQAGLTRHRILRVNCGQLLGTGWNAGDRSGLASLDPNLIPVDTHNTVTDRGPEGAPHFLSSKRTSDGQPGMLGFEVALFVDGIAAGEEAAAAAGGYTLTPWILLENSYYPNFTGAGPAAPPLWLSLLPATLVQPRELFRTFDVNAVAVRFQITNLALDPAANNRSIYIAFAEL